MPCQHSTHQTHRLLAKCSMEICDVLFSNHRLIFLDGNARKTHLNTQHPETVSTGKIPETEKPTVKPRHSFATRALKPTKRRSSYSPCGGLEGLEGLKSFTYQKNWEILVDFKLICTLKLQGWQTCTNQYNLSIWVFCSDSTMVRMVSQHFPPRFWRITIWENIFEALIDKQIQASLHKKG